MPLGRSHLTSLDAPTKIIEEPTLGGEILIRAVPMGDEMLSAFVDGPPPISPDQVEDQEVRLGKNASAAEKQAATVANRVLREALRRQPPSRDEKLRRQIVGTFILGVLEPDGERMFSWDDIDLVRSLNWNGVSRVATAIWDLSAGPDLEESKSDAPG